VDLRRLSRPTVKFTFFLSMGIIIIVLAYHLAEWFCRFSCCLGAIGVGCSLAFFMMLMNLAARDVLEGGNFCLTLQESGLSLPQCRKPRQAGLTARSIGGRTATPRNMAVFLRPQHGKPYGRAVREAARLAGSNARSVNPHGLAHPFDSGQAGLQTLHWSIAMFTPHFVPQPGVSFYWLSETDYFRLEQLASLLTLISEGATNIGSDIQIDPNDYSNAFALFAGMIRELPFSYHLNKDEGRAGS
jgi:hypothetical protein